MYRAVSFVLILVSVFGCIDGQRRSALPVTHEEDDYYATTAYIGDMYYLPQICEWFTRVHFKPEHTDTGEKELLPALDSVITGSSNLTRRRVPMDQARKYFILSGLDSVFVFNMTHDLLAKVALAGVELIERGGDRKFVAVYAAPRFERDAEELYYCVSQQLPDHFIAGFSYSQINDPTLENYVLHQLQPNGTVQARIGNVAVRPSGVTYSVITTPQRSYLTELIDSKVNILKDMNGRYRIERIVPLPYEFNSRPLLLGFLYVPGTDERLVSLAVFTDYQEYRFLYQNRIRLKSIGREVQFGM